MGLNAKEEQILTNIGTSVGLSYLRKVLTKGANLPDPPAPAVSFFKADGTQHSKDTRVKITVPNDYYTTSLMMPNPDPGSSGVTGPAIFGGIIFPYTPTIQYEYKATYTPQTPAHSNFTQYFYQNSSVTPILISGKFTVENDIDAEFLLMTIHLLRTLTKMKTGTDSHAGAPPPVCRLSAYGSYMLENVPVVITSFKHEYPENIDYFTTSKNPNEPGNPQLANNTVPIISTISITCTPVYSRKQISEFSVDKWVRGEYNAPNAGKGYL